MRSLHSLAPDRLRTLYWWGSRQRNRTRHIVIAMPDGCHKPLCWQLNHHGHTPEEMTRWYVVYPTEAEAFDRGGKPCDKCIYRKYLYGKRRSGYPFHKVGPPWRGRHA